MELWQQCQSDAVSRLGKLDSGIISLSFAPDGDRLVATTLGGDAEMQNQGRLVVWETGEFAVLNTNQWNGRVTDDYGGGALRWSPRSDKLWVLSKDCIVAELSVDGGSMVRPSFAKSGGKGENGQALAVSPSGDRLATGTSSIISIWDVRTRQILRSLNAHFAYIGALAFSPDGRWLVSASADQTIRLWDTTDWHSRKLQGHSDEVHALAFTPDGALLASGSRDGEMLLWRTDSLRSFAERERLPAGVDQAVLVPGGRRVLASMTNQSVVLIDAGTLAISPLPFAASSAWVLPGGIAVLAEGANRLRFIEAADSGYRVLGEMNGRIMGGVAYSPEKRLVAFGSGTNSVMCVPLEPFGPSFQLSGGHGRVDVSHFTGGGRLIAGVDGNQDVLLWDVQERCVLHRFSNLGWANLIVPADCREIVIYQEANRELSFQDAASPEQVLARTNLPYTVGLSLRLSPDNRRLAVAVQDAASVQLFDLKSRRLERVFERHVLAAHNVIFSPNGRRLATSGDRADAVKLWDVETGQELLTLPGEGVMYWSVQFSDDGNLILAGSGGEGDVWELWRAASWAEIASAEQATENER